MTASNLPLYSLTNVVVGDVGTIQPLLLSRYTNRVFGRRVADNTLMYSDDEMATWTATTFTNKFGLQAVVETYDGEILVLHGQGQQLPTNYVYKSSGWSANPATATFNLKLTVPSGVSSLWGFGLNGMGADGTVVITTYGGQTNAGGLPSNDQTGHYSFISRDHGGTFSAGIDLLSLPGNPSQNPQGAHWHGNAYSQLDNCVWFTYGDNNYPDVRAMPGTGNTQLMRLDLDTMTLTFLPIGADYAGLTAGLLQQWTGVCVLDDGSVSLTPDAAPQAFTVVPRLGYRTYGPQHGMLVSDPEGTWQIGGPIVRAKKGNPYLTASELDGTRAMQANIDGGLRVAIYAAVDGLAWQRIYLDTAMPLKLNQFIQITPIGVLASGKFVCRTSNTNSGAWANGGLITGTLTLA
jgi:hypothetical protein